MILLLLVLCLAKDKIESQSPIAIGIAVTFYDLPLCANNELRPDRPDNPDQPEKRPPPLSLPLVRDDEIDPRDGQLNEPNWATGKATASKGVKRRVGRIFFLAAEMKEGTENE